MLQGQQATQFASPWAGTFRLADGSTCAKAFSVTGATCILCRTHPRDAASQVANYTTLHRGIVLG